MNTEKILKVLLGGIVSEKTTMSSVNNQYVFKVLPNSNKREIRAAVEELFGVSVQSVNTLNVKGKKKLSKGRAGYRHNWKKAIVRVAPGQMIDISGAS